MLLPHIYFVLAQSLDLNIIFYLIIIIICYVVFIAFNINHSSILPLMALNSLYCADVPLSNYSLTPLVFQVQYLASSCCGKAGRVSVCSTSTLAGLLLFPLKAALSFSSHCRLTLVISAPSLGRERVAAVAGRSRSQAAECSDPHGRA